MRAGFNIYSVFQIYYFLKKIDKKSKALNGT